MTREGSRLGPLAEREFRLLFLGHTSSFVGSAFANVALAFAVLDLTGSKADLGFVLAVGSLPTIVFLLVGGIWADRLPRHHVMVVSNLVSGACQAAVAALLFAGEAQVWEIAALAAVRGAAIAFFFPASSGVVPQTVPQSLLQQANAALRLSRNTSVIVGGALAGLVVAATSPAVGIAVDAGMFFVAAGFIGAMHLPASLRMEATSFTADLVEGWREFASRTWLWAVVLQFSIVNAVEIGAQGVLGPAIAKQSLHGAAGWGFVLAAEAAGLAAGGLLMLRMRPHRMLLAATVGMLLTVPLLLGLAVPLSLLAVVGLAFVAGLGGETFGVLWDTTMQQEIPQDRLSRVYSYDALGSWALVPLGLAVVGPISEAVGTQATLVGAALLSLGATLAVFLVRDVRELPRRDSVALEATI
jgi:Major Facilitator Superfamily